MKERKNEMLTKDVTGKPVAVVKEMPLPTFVGGGDPFAGGDVVDGTIVPKSKPTLQVLAPVISTIEKSGSVGHDLEIQTPSDKAYFANVPTVAALPEISSTLFDAEAVLATIDRADLDSANVDFATAEVWLQEAKDNHQVAVAAYSESLANPFSSLTDMYKSMNKLAEKATQADDAETFAQGRVNALRAKLIPLQHAYNAQAKEKIQAALMPLVSDLRAKQSALQEWFKEKVLFAYKSTGVSSPGPDVWHEYDQTFSALKSVEAGLAGIAGEYQLGIGVTNESFKPLSPDGIIALAKYDDIHQFDVTAAGPDPTNRLTQPIDATHPLKRSGF